MNILCRLGWHKLKVLEREDFPPKGITFGCPKDKIVSVLYCKCCKKHWISLKDLLFPEDLIDGKDYFVNVTLPIDVYISVAILANKRGASIEKRLV